MNWRYLLRENDSSLLHNQKLNAGWELAWRMTADDLVDVSFRSKVGGRLNFWEATLRPCSCWEGPQGEKRSYMICSRHHSPLITPQGNSFSQTREGVIGPHQMGSWDPALLRSSLPQRSCMLRFPWLKELIKKKRKFYINLFSLKIFWKYAI